MYLPLLQHLRGFLCCCAGRHTRRLCSGSAAVFSLAALLRMACLPCSLHACWQHCWEWPVCLPCSSHAHWQHCWEWPVSLTARMLCHCGFCCPPCPSDLVMTFPFLQCVLTLVSILVFSSHWILKSSLWTQSWRVEEPIDLSLSCDWDAEITWI